MTTDKLKQLIKELETSGSNTKAKVLNELREELKQRGKIV